MVLIVACCVLAGEHLSCPVVP